MQKRKLISIVSLQTLCSNCLHHSSHASFISEIEIPTSLQGLDTQDSVYGKVLVHKIKLYIKLFHLK